LNLFFEFLHISHVLYLEFVKHFLPHLIHDFDNILLYFLHGMQRVPLTTKLHFLHIILIYNNIMKIIVKVVKIICDL